MTQFPIRLVSASDINALLPQTQCTQCSYKGCLPYAEAIAAGQADINRCPPGGEAGIRQLAKLTGLAVKPMAADVAAPKPRALAVIDETNCIGCTLCIQACPVDAILGAAKLMHTVISDHCTGCELCVAPCPVDVISMQPVTPCALTLTPEQSQRARQRYEARLARLARERAEKAQRLASKPPRPAPEVSNTPSPAINTLDEQKKAVIAAAMRRAAEKQAQRKDEEPS